MAKMRLLKKLETLADQLSDLAIDISVSCENDAVELARAAEENTMAYVSQEIQACLLANGLNKEFAAYVAYSATCHMWFRDYEIDDEGNFQKLASLENRLSAYESELGRRVKFSPEDLTLPKLEFDAREKYKVKKRKLK